MLSLRDGPTGVKTGIAGRLNVVAEVEQCDLVVPSQVDRATSTHCAAAANP